MALSMASPCVRTTAGRVGSRDRWARLTPGHWIGPARGPGRRPVHPWPVLSSPEGYPKTLDQY